MRALVINKSYEPMMVVSAEKAFCMMLTGRAVVEKYHDEVFHTIDSAFRQPCVVRLTEQANWNPLRGKRVSRYGIILRDAYTCQYCGSILPRQEITIDHVLPKSRGGEDTWSNLVAACFDCNNKKRDRTPKEAGLVLLNKPKKPSYSSFFRGPWQEFLW